MSVSHLIAREHCICREGQTGTAVGGGGGGRGREKQRKKEMAERRRREFERERREKGVYGCNEWRQEMGETIGKLKGKK